MVLAGQGIEFNFQADVKLQDQCPARHGTAHPPSLLLGYLLNHELAIAIAKASCDSTPRCIRSVRRSMLDECIGRKLATGRGPVIPEGITDSRYSQLAGYV